MNDDTNVPFEVATDVANVPLDGVATGQEGTEDAGRVGTRKGKSCGSGFRSTESSRTCKPRLGGGNKCTLLSFQDMLSFFSVHDTICSCTSDASRLK